jgi:tRNA modification GTPase
VAMINLNDTIVAPATPSGVSALAVVRVSGPEAISIVNSCFTKDIRTVDPYTIHYGHIKDEETFVDEVLVSVFKNPKSYTGQDSVEISGHGSPYITERIVQTLIKYGARMADPGEFTLRAFMNQKLDLAQAEAVADMISSNSEASLQMALQQMRGGFSEDIKYLRQELIDFAALIELENDFGEEDVEFADRGKLEDLIRRILQKIESLRSSFASGNALKKGISTAIVGKPNAGKSTLLNALLKDERAIVSDIEGTTRDTIEETFMLGGIPFRLIDTAGIRESSDEIEQLGVQRTLQEISKAQVVVYLFDAAQYVPKELEDAKKRYADDAVFLAVANKSDLGIDKGIFPEGTLFISAKEDSIDEVIQSLKNIADTYEFGQETMINNVRHADALAKSSEALQAALTGLQSGLTGDLVALDIRQALHFLGLITGEVTTDDLLGSIFGRFCIGK